MSDAAIIAFGAVSALGEGRHAAPAGIVGQPAFCAIMRDDELTGAGLARPFAARAPVPIGVRDRARWLLRRALTMCMVDLDRTRPAWRAERVGLIVGTSSGGMRRAEEAFERVASGARCDEGESATYYGPVASVARELRAEGAPVFDPAVVVLGACASSALAIGLGCRWLSRGGCDIVFAGGFDDVTFFVAAGFEALRATTASPPPRPFRVGRDGMALGEGAGMVALARDERAPRAFVTGFGAASDAVHLTAPDRHGRGLERAARAALDEARGPRIDLVSPHATATPFNDPVEAQVIAALLGTPEPVAAPLKAQIGHTLGAAGVLETLACVDALERGVLPASVGSGPIDPTARVRLLEAAEPASPRAALKMASAFGGSNAALVVSREPGLARSMRAAFVSAAAIVTAEPSTDALAAAIGTVDAAPRLARGDGLVRWALAAVAQLRQAGLPIEGGGVVVGSALATLETNALFARKIRERGARAAEPRRFPYTSPNAVAGECSIVFGLTGPSFAVGGGMHAAIEALAAAAVLVEAGDAERVVVVAVDELGPASAALGAAGSAALRTGAVALRVSAEADGAVARVGAVQIARGVEDSLGPAGHLALAPLAALGAASSDLGVRQPWVLTSASPPDVVARVVLEPL